MSGTEWYDEESGATVEATQYWLLVKRGPFTKSVSRTAPPQSLTGEQAGIRQRWEEAHAVH